MFLEYDINSQPDGIDMDEWYHIVYELGIVLYDSNKGMKPQLLEGNGDIPANVRVLNLAFDEHLEEAKKVTGKKFEAYPMKAGKKSTKMIIQVR